MKKQNAVQKITLSAVFMALSYVLPFLTGQIPEIGSMLCPMHIPVILCGFVCGAPWAVLIGFIVPLLRSVTLGVPVLFPNAVSMAFEIAAYGFVVGILYRIFPKKTPYIYFSLIISMVIGRLVWGAVQLLCVGLNTEKFPFSAFWAGAVVNALPGIIIQIVLIPILVVALEKLKPAVRRN